MRLLLSRVRLKQTLSPIGLPANSPTAGMSNGLSEVVNDFGRDDVCAWVHLERGSEDRFAYLFPSDHPPAFREDGSNNPAQVEHHFFTAAWRLPHAYDSRRADQRQRREAQALQLVFRVTLRSQIEPARRHRCADR